MKLFTISFCALTLSLFTAHAATEIHVSTSLPIAGRQIAELAFDGNADTAFRSSREVRDGDDVTFTFPTALTNGNFRFATGTREERHKLTSAALEWSGDGSNFVHGVAFTNGLANFAVTAPTSALRIRCLGGESEPLVLSEVALTGVEKPLEITFKTRFVVHTEVARKARKFAAKAKELCEEWYPKLYAQFDTPEGPAPSSVVHLWFQPMDGVAFAAGDRIHISERWVTEQSPEDYGMVVHELFHIVQAYRGGGEGWATEGLADYVRMGMYEPGTPLPKPTEKSSYRDAYKTTAAFFIWLEKGPAPGIALELNAASRKRESILDIFKNKTGKDVDTLWAEYFAAVTAKSESQ